MSTRFYFSPNWALPASDATPSTWSAGWNQTTGTIEKTLLNGSFGPAFTASTAGPTAFGTSGSFTAVARFVSVPLASDQTIAGTVKGQVKCNESASAADNFTLALAIKIIQPDGTDRGILLAVTASDNTAATPPEMPTSGAPTNRSFNDAAESAAITLSSVLAYTGDRIVVEVGHRQASTSVAQSSIFFCADSGHTDLPEDQTTTTTLNTWIEFSQTLKLQYYFNSATNPADGLATTNTADPTAVTPPTGMLAGDLVCMIGNARVANLTPTVSQASGQTWTSHAAISTTTRSARLFTCTFNGTWGADPSVSFSSTTCNSVQMHVFRPPTTNYSWNVNKALVELDIAAAPHTITGQTTIGDIPTISLAGWFSADDNTWGTLGGGEWQQCGLPQYRNTSGSDQSAAYAFKVRVTPGATADVTNQQLTLGDDPTTTFIVTMAQVQPVPPDIIVGPLSVPYKLQ